MSSKLLDIKIAELRKLKFKYDSLFENNYKARRAVYRKIKDLLEQIRVLKRSLSDNVCRNNVIIELDDFYNCRACQFMGKPNWGKYTTEQLQRHLAKVKLKGHVN